MVTYRTKMVFGLIGLLLSVILSVSANAAENRFFLKMPTANKTTAGAVLASKKAGFECTKVKIGAHGNAVNVPGSVSQWFSDVPQSEESADDALGNGKKVVRCLMKIYNKEKHRMSNADVGDGDES